MSWLNKVKDHVGSGITSPGTGPITLSEEAKAILAQAEAMRRVTTMQNQIYGGSYATSPGSAPYTYQSMIFMRLGAQSRFDSGFDFIEATKLSDDKMVVFCVVNGKHVSIEDDFHLFPSDTLVTQLRVLRK